MKYLVIILGILFSFSCVQEEKKKVSYKDVEAYKAKLVGIHKEIVRKQTDSIKRYIDSLGFEMKQTPTGLWYKVFENGNGGAVKNGDFVYLKYTASLMNGGVCYTSDSLGLMQFQVGRGGVPSGVEEAVLLLQKGDKAELIIPSHLAYGVAGDMERIPRLSILCYHIELIEVERHRN